MYSSATPRHQLCSLPGCTKPRSFNRSTGKSYEHCGKAHYLEHQSSRGLCCLAPHCPRQRRPFPDGSGYHNYCSISCRDRNQLCSLPGCTNRKRFDPATRQLYDYCGRTHYLEHQRSLSSVKAPSHLQCKATNCPRQRRPTPDGSGYYDYCSIACRDHDKRAPKAPAGGQVTRTRCTPLKAGSTEYQSVYRKFAQDWVKGTCPRVDFVLKIRCPELEERWEDFGEVLSINNGSPSAVEEHYHGTTIRCDLTSTRYMCSDGRCGVCGISREGFKRSRIGMNIPGFKRFGHGFYLSPHSSKCHDYTQGSHAHRAMLLCDVLPGDKCVVWTDQPHLTAPPPGYDSVYGQPGVSLNYPEIVLYDEEAILPRYVIMYKKDGIGKIAQ